MAYKKDRHILKEIVYRENNSSVPESWINFIQKIFERKIHWIDRLSEIPIAKVFVFHKDKMKLESFIKEIKQSEDYGDFSISSRSEEHTSELQSRGHLVCRLLLEKKKEKTRDAEKQNIIE